MITTNNPKSILLIKPGAIGDLLQLTPLIRTLKTAFPNSEITLLLGSSATAALFRYNPHIRETLIFDKTGKDPLHTPLLKLWHCLRERKFDLVVNFQRSNLKTWFLATAAFPCGILVYHKAKDPAIHVVDNYLETLAPLGIAFADRKLEISFGKDDEQFADGFFSSENFDNKPVIALNPGASHPVNRWSTNRFAVLADMLAEKLSAKVILVGGPQDSALAHEIISKTESKPLDLTDRTSLLQTAALLKKCALLVSGDTGPLHLATAVGTRVVALFGAADPARTGPVGAGHRVIQAKDAACVPCRSRTCNNSVYLDCMEKISAQEVFQAIAEMLRPT
jgi:ADP-heptose:LPS heptosyltransferase